jgi:hypothetical protein
MQRRRISERKGKFSVRLESLEPRSLLSGKASQIAIQEIPASMAPGEYELLITGTKKNDSISISDNGTGTSGNMFVSTGSGIDYTSQHAISMVGVATGGGTDNVTYELDGNLLSTQPEVVLAASGGSSEIGKTIRGGGSLHFTANIVGRVGVGASLTVGAFSDPKAPTAVAINDSGEIDGTLEGGVVPAKGIFSKVSGNVVFNLNATSTIGTGGELSAVAYGGSKTNSLNASYFGTNQGDLSVEEFGYGAKDNITSDLEMTSTSTGTVGADSEGAVAAYGKKARAQFTILRGADSTSTTGIQAVIVTESKKSVASQTGNVQNETAGSDTIIT